MTSEILANTDLLSVERYELKMISLMKLTVDIDMRRIKLH